MARRTTKKVSTTSKTPTRTRAAQRVSGVDYFRFGESYTSLILGIVVVIIASILLISFVRNRSAVDILKTDTPDISSTKIGPESETTGGKGSRYTVQEGDDLWTIAEKNYQSGYNWVDIQKANNIENPNVIVAGTELVIPDVPSKEKTIAQAPSQAQPTGEKITGSTYTIKEGDTLWDIAIRRYNDGYQWPKIAEANSLSNPDIILTGNTLKLP